jgi:hypothetical protein
VLAAVAASSVVAASALAGTSGKTLAFSAKYAGKANVSVVDQIASYTAIGKGKGKLIGVGKVTGKGAGDASKKPCSPFGGAGLMKGTKGSISFKAVTQATACGDQDGQIFSLSGRVKVLKGTGTFKHARGGILKFTGVYDRGHGTFSVKFFGSLSA